ncbi:RepB family plasmid replication initiator protein [Commensalibacter oyaizuii]|uniref:RepB family plasmid replication initiator protein n=1 Tax=Commensalibacter oyaizuii TaxID=3043873 RepID=UPI0038D13736
MKLIYSLMVHFSLNSSLLKVNESSEIFKITPSVAYRQLKEAVNNISKRYITYTTYHEKTVGIGRINWLSAYKYFDTERYVRFRFNDALFSYLFEL